MAAATATAAVMPAPASYSYKPQEGDPTASTVVPLKKGGFLEVRRGEKTHWAVGEARCTWATLDEWKATLPAGAVIVEKGRRRKSPTEARSCWTTDFRMAYELAGSPSSAPILVDNNKTRAEKWIKDAVADTEFSQKYYAANLEKATSKEEAAATLTFIGRCRNRISRDIDRAREILAAPPFERHYCEKYGPGRRMKAIKVQRISDREFIPLFFDTTTGTLHSPADATSYDVGCKGKTFEELGVSPIFLQLTDMGSIKRL